MLEGFKRLVRAFLRVDREDHTDATVREVGSLLAAVTPDRVRVVDDDLEGREVGRVRRDEVEAGVEANHGRVGCILELAAGVVE